MSAARKILVRTLVKPFYQANAGFFLITVGLLFGFLKTPQHIDIAAALAVSPLYYVIPFTLFTLYTFKTLQFCFTAQRLKTNQFLGWLVLLKPATRIPLVIYIQILLLAPVLGYSGLLLFMALQLRLWTSAAIVVGGNLALIMVAGHFLHKRLITAVDPSLLSGFRLWTSRLPKPFPMLFIHHLFSRQAVLLLGTKVISIGVIAVAVLIFQVEGTDYRLLTLGMLLSGGVNAAFSFHYHRFEQTGISVFKNLPISVDSWFVRFTLTYLVLFIPEMVVFLGNTIMVAPIDLIIGSSLLPVALLSFYQSILYRRSLTMDHFIKYPFFTTASLFFVILGYVPAYTLVIGLLLISYLIFRFSYRSFNLVAGN
ncbi:MAG: hypothetical protein HEP71_16225 [Roseivirga sp.]|nr:hypothetical protein [Roseivirga sp.]